VLWLVVVDGLQRFARTARFRAVRPAAVPVPPNPLVPDSVMENPVTERGKAGRRAGNPRRPRLKIAAAAPMPVKGELRPNPAGCAL